MMKKHKFCSGRRPRCLSYAIKITLLSRSEMLVLYGVRIHVVLSQNIFNKFADQIWPLFFSFAGGVFVSDCCSPVQALEHLLRGFHWCVRTISHAQNRYFEVGIPQQVWRRQLCFHCTSQHRSAFPVPSASIQVLLQLCCASCPVFWSEKNKLLDKPGSLIRISPLVFIPLPVAAVGKAACSAATAPIELPIDM